MKNTVLNYTTEELDEFIISDYFSKDVAIYDIFTELEPYLELYKIDNDDKLEHVSYNLYGTPDYWDILLLINDRNPLFQMPYNYDILYTNSALLIDAYKNFIYSHAPLDIGRADTLLNEFLALLEDNNEAYRFIHIIKPSLITNAISLLKQKGYV